MMNIMNNKIAYGWLPVAVICLSACSDNDKSSGGLWNNPADERMELTASAQDLELDGDKPDEVVLTFNWTPAREMPEDYIISYVTKMDLEGNDFNSAVRSDENEGVFSKSYTTAELQNLLVEKWGQSSTKAATVQFRTIAKWDGGSRFAMPEVRTVSVNIRPYKPIVFDADKVYLDGTAMTGGKVTMSKTVEDEHQYAFYGSLRKGTLEIPVEFEGETNYICSESKDGILKDGIAENIVMRKEAIAWNIPKEGEYRIVVNLEKKTVTINSPDKPLTPVSVKWTGSVGEYKDKVVETTVTKLYAYGGINNWSNTCTTFLMPSVADPLVFTYKGTALKAGTIKFLVYSVGDGNTTRAYAYSCPLKEDGTSQEMKVNLGAVMSLSGGDSSAQRNSYFKIDSGVNFIVVNLRTMEARFEKR